tara:strand:- start:866 stop:1018 length:153 start_codon:yes stop_codon:yes gene_type:complete
MKVNGYKLTNSGETQVDTIYLSHFAKKILELGIDIKEDKLVEDLKKLLEL